MIVVRALASLRIFSSPKCPDRLWYPPPASYSMGTVGSALGVKRLGRKADSYRSSRHEVKNTWSNTSISYVSSSWSALQCYVSTLPRAT